ncbi:triacylglycerol lipase precursor [Scheffersomyces xylosifermentans]|uniref:triacylglycerol lipase precursor n=1 Tax=Scheffersomyces xylosifermentans TaxID=1304137 RepID=UPI00315DC3C7
MLMNLRVLTSIVLTLFSFGTPTRSAPVESAGVGANDYNKLVDYAHLTSFAYCLKRGLTKGKLGSTANCPSKVCKEDRYAKVDIWEVFNFNDWGEVGSGYIAVDHDTERILLVFRGTASTRDWFSDMDFKLVPYKPLVYSGKFTKESKKFVACDDCKVHRGFYNFLKKNCGGVLNKVSAVKKAHPTYQLVLSGHSLGAALALLSGIEFNLMGYQPLIITYAGSKVGNGNFVDFTNRLMDNYTNKLAISSSNDFKSGYVRVVHKLDIVPSLPPSPLFKHGGFEYYIDKRSLPHTPSDIERRGDDFSTFNTKREPKKPSLSKLWPDSMGKYEHTHYFIKITGCDSELKDS